VRQAALCPRAQHQLALNNGKNHLHGGPTGFWSRLFEEVASAVCSFQLSKGCFVFHRALQKEIVKTKNGVAVVLRYVSPDGEEGYPGRLEVTVSSRLPLDIVDSSSQLGRAVVVQAVFSLNDKNELGMEFLGTTDGATRPATLLSAHSLLRLPSRRCHHRQHVQPRLLEPIRTRFGSASRCLSPALLACDRC
jgi:galactose mutarotase-like enzyme